MVVDHVDRGYRADQILTMMVDPLGARYPTDESLLQFFDAIEHEVMALPGVHSVAWTSGLPLGPADQGPVLFDVVGDPAQDESKRPSSNYQIVSRCTSARSITVVAGRSFDEHDTKSSVPVCMVNEAFVRGYLHGRSATGTRIAVWPDAPNSKPVIREIVGVARQVKGRPDEAEDLVQVYVPMAQDPVDETSISPSGRRPDAPKRWRPRSGRAIGRIDKEQLVSVRDVVTLEDVAWEATGRHRFRAVMVITFATLGAHTGDDRRVRDPRLLRTTAHARLRCPASASRHDR